MIRFQPLLLLISLIMSTPILAQDADYFRSLDTPTTSYTAATSITRMIDGAGFRFFWATHNLRPEDLAYRPSEEARTTEETVDHVYDMVRNLCRSIQLEPRTGTDYASQRTATLENLWLLRDHISQLSEEELAQLKIRAGSANEYPFMLAINGQISDCIWHSGQIASFRRTSGNPIPEGISFFRGEGAK